MTLAASRARTWANLVLAGAAFAFAHDWQFIPASGALLTSFVMAVRGARLRLAAAVAGAVSIQVLFHQRSYAFRLVIRLSRRPADPQFSSSYAAGCRGS